MADVRYALRTLARNPGFALIAVLVLALGIGANSAIFTVVNAVLLRSLPYKDPDRLVMVSEQLPKLGSPPIPFSAPDYEELERRTQSFSSVGCYQNRDYELSGVDQPERLTGARVSAGLFPTLGVEPAPGRAFTREEDKGARPVVLLSYGLWQRKFAADPALVGKAILLDRRPYTVVGILPRGFEFPPRGPTFNHDTADIFVPASFTRSELEGFGNMYNNSVVARLKPGVTLQQARAETGALIRRFSEQYPAIIRNDPRFELVAMVNPLRAEIVGGIERLLLVLFGAVGMVLLIGCTDVASLVLARATSRSREIAVRRALGAGRLLVVRQMLTESLVLALAGGGLGLLFALWGTDLLVRITPVAMPRPHAIHVNGAVLAFTLALSAGAALVFGLAPALEASRGEIGEALREGGRSATPGRRRQRLFGLLVASQFALAVVLLIGAGLLVRSFVRLLQTNPGFRPQHVLSMATTLPASGYGKAAQIRSFYERLLERVRSLPGVTAAAAGSDLPLAVRETRVFTAEERSAAGQGPPPSVNQHYVTPGYFEALGIPLKRGRHFGSQDRRDGPPVAIINETMARQFWPGRDPIGRRMKWGLRESDTPWMTIVGVAGDVKQTALHVGTMPQAYTPYDQARDAITEDNITGMLRSLYLVVRTELEPEALVKAVRAEIRALDPALPVAQVQTLDRMLSDSLGPQRFSAFLLAAFAAAALLLAALGIAGVLSYSIAQRTHEMGVRIALGARRADVVRLVLRQGMLLAGIGTAAGLAAALALTRVMASLLFGVSARDPWTFAAIPALLAAVALVACYLPACRAARVNPIEALRCE